MQLDAGTLAAIGTTVLSVGGGAVATIKFLFARWEAAMNERIEEMEKHMAKLERRVDECELERGQLRQEIHSIRRAQGVMDVKMDTKMDNYTPGHN